MATPTAPTPHMSLMVVVGEVVFVSILSIIAGASPEMETLVVTFLVGLWLLYLINTGPSLFNSLKIRR